MLVAKTFWQRAAVGFVLWLYSLSLMLGLTVNSQVSNLTDRSITLDSAVVEATTGHDFGFTFTTTEVVGSIVFEYCGNSPLFDQPCTAPGGLDVSGAALSSQSGETGFSIHGNTDTSTLVISRTPAATSTGPVEYDFSGAVNPDTANDTTYVRISTHAADDGTGANIDEGAVAFSLTANLAVSAYVPPYIALCVGVTVAAKCQTSSGSGVNLGTFSPNGPKTATTQFASATNDESGYTVSVLGTTMTSGNNFIKALGSPVVSIPGTSQFGINLKNNSLPNVGKNKSGVGSATVISGYNKTNRFKFKHGDVVAKSSVSTDYNRFTISYLANVPGNQPPGVYSTTLTYLAFASF